MRESTMLFVAYKQPGLKGSETTVGPLLVKDAIRFMATKMASDPMRGTHMDFRLAPTKDRVSFDKSVKDSDINEILAGFDFNDGDES